MTQEFLNLRSALPRIIFLALVIGLPNHAPAASVEPVWSLVQRERPALVETLRQLVNIESGSRDKEGLDRVAAYIRQRLAALGAHVEYHETTQAETYRLFDTPEDLGKVVIGRFEGTGSRKIMLMAHMDTVYPIGTLATRPFRIQESCLWTGNRRRQGRHCGAPPRRCCSEGDRLP